MVYFYHRRGAENRESFQVSDTRLWSLLQHKNLCVLCASVVNQTAAVELMNRMGTLFVLLLALLHEAFQQPVAAVLKIDELDAKDVLVL